MKTTLLAIVLAVAVAAAAQDATQTPSQPAPPAGAQSQAPVIKDAAEYNAYVGAIQQTDNKRQDQRPGSVSVQYPNSVMKNLHAGTAHGAYLQLQDQAKVVDAAKRLLAADPCNLRALALLSSLSRQSALPRRTPQEQVADTAQYSGKGLECVATAQKPATMSQTPTSTRSRNKSRSSSTAGLDSLLCRTRTTRRAAISAGPPSRANPNDIQNVYPLAMAYLTPKPPDSVNGLFFIARAVNLASPPGAGAD